MKCFVTGANGFIGSRLVEKLADKGYEVNCLVRSPEKFVTLRRKNTHPIFGDLDNSAALLTGSKDCDIVYHLAAYAKPWSKDPSLPSKINFQGTINLLEASLTNKVKKFIFTSSAAVLGPSPENNSIDEQAVRNSPFFNEYESTKTMAENACLEFSKKGLPVVILNPTRVYGPGPINESNSITKIIQMYQNGKWHILPGNGTKIGNYVFIDDVVSGHLLAAEAGITGERYILGGENLTFNQFFQVLSNVTGKQKFLVPFPVWLMLILGKIMESQAKLTGIPPIITSPWIRKYLNHWSLSSEKAARQLSYKITPFSEGAKVTVNWLNENK